MRNPTTTNSLIKTEKETGYLLIRMFLGGIIHFISLFNYMSIKDTRGFDMFMVWIKQILN